jgi:RimJ/RimL family protein N-acetyltransferase
MSMETNVTPPVGGHPILNILGDKVALGPLRRDLIATYQRWINDFEVTRTLGPSIRPITYEGEEKWYEGAATGDKSVSFTIYEKSTLRPIGNTSLMQIEHQHRIAEFGILIGEKEVWGKGYGTETARLLLDYGFTVLGLHNIMLRAASFNERGLRAYRRAGFREFGRRRESGRLGGQTFDTVYMDCLATDFQASVLGPLLTTRQTGGGVSQPPRGASAPPEPLPDRGP